ncbi:flavodoxin family protein [Bacillus tianshenii]|uniref:flavodoxin family protein n=1 Tax=Sutcliffiella tianshenii TaxID=1463404 RepID=UPI001CD600A4|nr:flavodoxin family protein [Bacillus tianshenii]MCA1321240.1 flavodoxin family protein [Bacillus tianshenii]
MLVIYGSHRNNGNSEQLAKLLIKEMNAEEIFLRDLTIYPILDQRHDVEGFKHQGDDYYGVVERLLQHDEVILVTPLYWYGMSGRMKNFVDRWSESLRDGKIAFRESMKSKKFYVVVVGGDDPNQKALPLIMQFRHIVEFFGAKLEDYIIGVANSPGHILEDEHAMKRAEILNRKWRNI